MRATIMSCCSKRNKMKQYTLEEVTKAVNHWAMMNIPAENIEKFLAPKKEEINKEREIKLWTGTLLLIPIESTAFEVRLAETTEGKKNHLCYRIVPKELVYVTDQRAELIDENFKLIGTKKELDNIKNFKYYEEILTSVLSQYKAYEEHCWDLGNTTYFSPNAVLRALINDDENNYAILYRGAKKIV